MRRAVVVLLALITLFAAGWPALAAPRSVPGEVLVRLSEPMDGARLARFLDRVGARQLPFRAPGHLLRIAAADGDEAALLGRVSGEQGVADASFNSLCRAAAVDDPYYPTQWNLTAINAEGAWAVQPDGASVVVAVLDTGVAYADAEIDGVTHVQAPGLAATTVVAPHDFVDDDDSALDLHGHGTHVATVIAQAVGDGLGGAGVAPGVTLMPVRVLDADALGSEADVIQGILHAAEQGAQVINLSLTFDPGYSPSSALIEAVATAYAGGALLVGAAGNDYGGPVLYPAALREVIAVGASRLGEDGGLELAPYSASGDARLDLLAPGGDVSRDVNGDGLADGILGESFLPGRPEQVGLWTMAGTSAAAAHVSGAAALLLAAGAEASTVRDRLNASARDDGEDGFDASFGHGHLDAGAALGALDAGDPLPEAETRLVEVWLKFKKQGRDGPQLIAKLKLRDANGRPVVGERLFGRWFGKISESVECTTDRKGRCTVVRRLLDADGGPGGPGAVDAIAGFTVDRTAGAAGLGTTPQGFIDFLRKLWQRWLSAIVYRIGLDVQLDPQPVNDDVDLPVKDEPDDLIGAQGLGTTPVGFCFDWWLIRFQTENPFVIGVWAAQARDASVGAAPVQH